jgi:hypothetical protein
MGLMGAASELAGFLAARYAEDWGSARDRELAAGLDESRATRDIDAKREILLLCETETAETGGRPLALRIQRHLASVYSDHPDYGELRG